MDMSWQQMRFWPESLYVQRAEGTGQLLLVRFNYEVWHRVGGKDQYPAPGLVRRILEGLFGIPASGPLRAGTVVD